MSQNEQTLTPTRERVEAYEKALRCRRAFGLAYDYCARHNTNDCRWTDDGCPVAVAAAHVEAERVAELEAALEKAESQSAARGLVIEMLREADEADR